MSKIMKNLKEFKVKYFLEEAVITYITWHLSTEDSEKDLRSIFT